MTVSGFPVMVISFPVTVAGELVTVAGWRATVIMHVFLVTAVPQVVTMIRIQ